MGRKFLKRSKLVRLVLAFLPILVFSGLVYAGAASAATYYISPSGSDSAAGTSSAPWGTFAHAMSVLQPGDTLWLMDGTYTQSTTGMLYISINGTPSAYITVRALNEGSAIVDGQKSYNCCSITGNYIEVDGINFRNSGSTGSGWADGIGIWGSYVTLRRDIVNGYGWNTPTSSSENNSGGIVTGDVSNILIEDCAVYTQANVGSGGWSGRAGIDLHASNSIVRRNFIYWQPGVNPVSPEGIVIYAAANVIAENNVFIDNNSGGSQLFIWNHTYGSGGGLDGNERAYGNIFINSSLYSIQLATDNSSGEISGTVFKDNVVIKSQFVYAFANQTDENLTVTHNTVADSQDFLIQTNWGNNTYNNFYSNITGNSSYGDTGWLYINAGSDSESGNNVYSNYGGSSDSSLNADYNTSTYGNGAYLIPSSVIGNKGANALYEYVNGTLTSTPLWPWPMESRIQSELGMSVTWASNGGLWQTLNGVYPAGTTASTTTTSTGSTSGTTTTSTGSTSSTTTSTGSSSGNTTTTSTSSGTGSITNSTTGATSSSAAPELVSPSNGQVTSTTVTFAWTKPGQGNPAGYKLWYSQNSDLSSGSLATVTNSQAQAQANSAFAGLGMGLLPFGIMFPAGIMFTNKKKRLLLVATLLVAAVAFSSCGGGGGASGTTASSGGNTASSNVSTTVSGLASGTTYYWAVQTVDSSGHVTSQSSTGSFKTQ